MIEPVIVCSLNYEQTATVEHDPMVVRLRNVNMNRFEVLVESTCM